MEVEEKFTSLKEHMAELLDQKPIDYDEVKTTAGKILALHKSFPADLRFRIWEVLLDVSERTEPDFDLMIKTQARFSNDHVLTLDVDRSFNSIEEPRKTQLRNQLTTIISTYCAKYNVAYWQGMHDMVSVMLLMEPQPPLERIFLLFSMFLQSFLPYVFDDRECLFLQHLFEMIRLLLQYHDPQLSLYLQNHTIIPAIYSPSWLLTLFAHDVTQPLLLSIWDQYIFYKNPSIHVFTILAHLISNKARIMSYPSSELLELMTHLPFENNESTYVYQEKTSEFGNSENAVDAVCSALNKEMQSCKCDPTIITSLVTDGIQLMKRTPPGFVHRLNDILNDQVTVSYDSLDAYRNASCLMASPVEIFTFLLRGIEKNIYCLHYLLLDTRPYAAYRRSHLTQSKDVTAHTLINQEKIELIVRKARNHEYHICILDNSSEVNNEGDVCAQLVEILLKRGCRYVSRVIGGYDRIAKFITMEGTLSKSGLITEETGYVAKDTEEVWEKSHIGHGASSPTSPVKQDMIKVINGMKCLLYHTWMENPQVYHYSCKKIMKKTKDGKEIFASSSEKQLILTNGFIFIIDINNCSEEGYAIIENRYKYDLIESVKETGKDFIYMILKPNTEGQKKKLLYYVAHRDECLAELKKKLEYNCLFHKLNNSFL